MRFFRYGPGLTERGIIMHVVTLRHRPDLADEEQVNSIWIHRLDPPSDAPGKTHRPWLLKAALARALANRATGAAAVLQPNSLSRQMVPVMLQARMRNIGLVFNFGITPEAPPSGTLHRLCRLAAALPVSAPLSRVVFLSHQLERQFRAVLPLFPSQKAIIPNGVDLTRFRPPSSAEERMHLRQSHGLREDQKTVLFVGGIMSRKGVDILLKAWNHVLQQHPDAVLLLLGSNGLRPSHDRVGLREELAAYLKEVETLCAQLTIPSSVHLLGEIQDPAPYYRMADVFAFPSHREGLPNVVLEAMASALPCLVARFDGIPQDGEEMGTAGTHYLSLSHAPEEWSAQLAEILHPAQVARRQELGENARQWIATHQNLSQILDTWAVTYRATVTSG